MVPHPDAARALDAARASSPRVGVGGGTRIPAPSVGLAAVTTSAERSTPGLPPRPLKTTPLSL